MNGRNLKRFRRGTEQKSETNLTWLMKQEKEEKYFAPLMDLCHLKNAELVTKHQKIRGRVVLRDDIVKDDSGSYAVFTEHGSSASQMTAAKVMDIISRLPGCDGQPADAVSGYTKWKWKMLTNYQKFPNRSVQTLGFVYHDKDGPNHGPVSKIQSFLLSGICTVILWQDCHGNGNLCKDNTSLRKSRRRCTKYRVNGATCCLQYLASFFE